MCKLQWISVIRALWRVTEDRDGLLVKYEPVPTQTKEITDEFLERTGEVRATFRRLLNESEPFEQTSRCITFAVAY